MSLNRVELSGTLTRDPEYRVLPSGAEVSSLSLAVNDAVWDSQAREQVVGTVFVQVEVWDVQAAAVLRRAEHLASRLAREPRGGAHPASSYDRQELDALRWVLDEVLPSWFGTAG
jgi:single-strand DNA-binding protein